MKTCQAVSPTVIYLLVPPDSQAPRNYRLEGVGYCLVYDGFKKNPSQFLFCAEYLPHAKAHPTDLLAAMDGVFFLS